MVYFDNPETVLEVKQLIIIIKNPNIWIIPDSVRMNEKSPSENKEYTITITNINITQYISSYLFFFMNF